MDFYRLFFVALNVLLVNSQTSNYRLPENVKPTSYVLTVDSDLETMVFDGTVSIILNVLTSTSTITLHSKDLTVKGVKLNKQDVKYDFNPEYDLMFVNTTQPLAANANVQLDISFSGTIGSGNVGYYRAYYNDTLGITKAMAVTHLEATNARRAFPCFDEPNFKATFQINLIRRPHQVTSSNMALIETISMENGNKTMDVYETSLKMSTYLVAYMVSEYGSMTVLENGVAYRTFARPELLKRGDAIYSLQVAPAAIRMMETLTGFAYPINKMDQVPVPNDYYKIGAMENWGMITYRERMLMYNDDLSTAQEKQSVATIIVHEFAHQWFGDLVTPEWWSYIWLNEGFATYLEQAIAHLVEPTWDLREQFVTANIQPAFDNDALESSRPMTRQVETPTEIDGIYDTIVYEKAGSVIRMAEGFLGSAAFQKGLQTYLKSNSYDNVNPSKLYDSWQNALNDPSVNVTEIMKTWETQPGYPVVTLTRQYGTNGIRFQQERFYINRKTGSDSSIWTIPLNYFTRKTRVNNIEWFSSREMTLAGFDISSNDWIIFNNHRKGFYRVNYDETNWKLITDFLRNGSYAAVIPIENRAQLIDDAFNLARTGRLNYTIAMELGKYVANETHYVPISTFNSVMSYLDKVFTGHNDHKSLKNYAIEILEPIYKRLGFKIASSDSHLAKLTKVNVNTWLCNYGHKECLEESVKLLEPWLNDTAVVQPDMQSYVYCYGMKGINQTQHSQAVTKYAASSGDTEKARIATGLGCAGNVSILSNFLQSLIKENTLSQTDKLNAITSVYTNNGADGVNLILEFLRTNFNDINQKIGNTARIISGVASRITTTEQTSMLNAFATQNSASMTDDLKKTVEAANVTAHNNINWIASNREDIILYLDGSSTTVFGSILLLLVCLLIHRIY